MNEDPERQKLINGSVESQLKAFPRPKATAVPKQLYKTKSRWIPSCWYIDCLPCIKARYVLAFMLFLGLSNVYALRVNLSVAIVQMTSKHPHHHQRFVNCHVSSHTNNYVTSRGGMRYIKRHHKKIVLIAYFYF